MSPSVIAFAAGLLGCGPVAFQDGSTIAILGTKPPAPEPLKEPPKVELSATEIKINDKVQFALNSAEILEVSHGLLDEVGQMISGHPELKVIEVGGHASADGDDAHNLKLSDKRAKAVMKYLTDKAGIEKTRLTAKGYGETAPIASNDTEEGKEKNRRVEFVITERDTTSSPSGQ